MLRWRLLLGFIFVTLLVGLCYLESWAPVGGLVLLPLGVLCMAMASNEVLDLMATGGVRPLRWVVHVGNCIIVIGSWAACVYRDLTEPAIGLSDHGWRWSSTACFWIVLALAGAVLLAFVAEMRRFHKPGGATINLAGAVFTITYVGLMMSFLVQIRMAWGLLALASVILVVKMTDVGAYAIGRLFGRNKMAPDLSPGKTIEGAIGGLAFACIGAWFAFFVMPLSATPLGWVTYGLVVGMASMAGDLAESLIKRDMRQKDSSRWMPGFGGVLDIFDSLLLAAPVAYAWWAFEFVLPKLQ